MVKSDFIKKSWIWRLCLCLPQQSLSLRSSRYLSVSLNIIKTHCSYQILINIKREIEMPSILSHICATKLVCVVLLGLLLALSSIRPLHGQVYQRHRHHNSTFITNLMVMLKTATYNAELATNYDASKHKGRSIFFSQGNIYDVEDEVKFYAHSVVNLPNGSIVSGTLLL